MILGDTVKVEILRHPGSETIGADGRPLAVVRTSIPDVPMTVQPLKQNEWQQLGLGGRVSDFRKGYTEVVIIEGDEVTKTQPDHVVHEGTTYLVVQSNNYTTVYPHYRVVLHAIPPTAGTGGGP